MKTIKNTRNCRVHYLFTISKNFTKSASFGNEFVLFWVLFYFSSLVFIFDKVATIWKYRICLSIDTNMGNNKLHKSLSILLCLGNKISIDLMNEPETFLSMDYVFLFLAFSSYIFLMCTIILFCNYAINMVVIVIKRIWFLKL